MINDIIIMNLIHFYNLQGLISGFKVLKLHETQMIYYIICVSCNLDQVCHVVRQLLGILESNLFNPNERKRF